MIANQDEVRRAIEALSIDECKRLRWAARKLWPKVGWLTGGREDVDYLQEAVVATLSGSRPWDKRYSMYQHLFRAIRSEVRNCAASQSQRYKSRLCSLAQLNDEKPDAEPRVTADDFLHPSKPGRRIEAKHVRSWRRLSARCRQFSVMVYGTQGLSVAAGCGPQIAGAQAD